jgi:hypothetical protein
MIDPIDSPDVELWGVRYRAERLVNAGADALQGDLMSGEDRSDSSEAREKLTAAVRAAKVLIQHLDELYDFDGEAATLKQEETCPD